MKKGLTTLLVILLAVGAMLVSCKAEVGTPADELVSASFELNSSRALSATLEPFNPGDYYWKYAAKKNTADTSGLNSGTTTDYTETGAEWVKVASGAPVAGLSGHIVPNFSQGLWDFTLFAYKLVGSEYKLVYQGEAKAVTLVKGGKNMVHVVVSPIPTGTGTLYIGTTTLTPHTSGDVPSVSRFLKVEDLDGTEYTPTTGTTYKLDAGAYKVTVTYKASGIVYAEGTVMATIYPNMTTTVSGSVDELVTYAQFVAEQNPDIIARTAEVDGITSTTTGDEQGNINLSEPATVEDKKVSATVPAAAAVALLPKVGEDPDPNASMSLMLNVDTKDSTSTSVTYEISMTKVVTLDSEVTTSDVTDLGKDAQNKKYYATAMVQLSKGLTGVKVQHDGNDMKESTDVKDDDGYGIYSYDADSGILTIITNTFSPFAVTYDGQTAGVAELNGKKYATLVEACNDLPDEGGTITLLSDAEGAGLFLPADRNMEIVLDLNKHTYTCTGPAVGSKGYETQALHLEKNNSVTIKNGTITSTSDAGVYMLVQNYCNLTLEDVVLDGSNIGARQYTLSNNCGTVVLKGSTSIIPSLNGRALDSCKFQSYQIPEVTIDTTGTIKGIIELSGGKLEILGGNFEGSISAISGYQAGDAAIKGGVYNYDPSAYVAEGCKVRYNETTKLWTVMSPGEIARELAIKAGAIPDTIVVYTDYAHGTLTDKVVYRFYADGSVYIVNAKDYNGWDGSSTDDTKFTVGKLLAVKGMSVDGMLDGSFANNITIKTLAFANDISWAKKALNGNSTIESVDFANLTTIPNRLFYGSSGITSVTIPSTITSIEEAAFQQSGVKSIVFAEGCSIAVIPVQFAYASALESITLPSSVTTINDKAFEATKIASIVIPASVKTIGNYICRDCINLTTAYIESEDVTFTGTSMVFAKTQGGEVNVPTTICVKNDTVQARLKDASTSQSTYIANGTLVITTEWPN